MAPPLFHGGWGIKWAVSAQPDSGSEKSKIDSSLGDTRVGVKPPTLYPSTTNSLKALCQLVPSDSPASWSHGVTNWGQNAKIGKIDRLRRPTRVGSCGDQVEAIFHTPFDTVHWGLTCSHAGSLASSGDGHVNAQKTAKHAKLCYMGIPVCCKSPTMPEEQK